MKSSEFGINCVHLLQYKCYKISLTHCGSYIDSPDQIKNKKAATAPINKKDNKCFQYPVTVALNHEKIEKDLQIITITKCNWEGINFTSAKDDWEKFEKKKVTIALSVSYAKKEEINPAYVSKHNSNRKKQVILLMVSNGEKCKWSETLITQANSEEPWH